MTNQLELPYPYATGGPLPEGEFKITFNNDFVIPAIIAPQTHSWAIGDLWASDQRVERWDGAEWQPYHDYVLAHIREHLEDTMDAILSEALSTKEVIDGIMEELEFCALAVDDAEAV